MFSLSAEHVFQAGNFGSRIVLYIDVVVLMDKSEVLITAMTHDSFVWLLLFSICIISSFFMIIPSVWFSQLVLYFFKHLFKLYIVASYCDGWNLMRYFLLPEASLHKWTSSFRDYIHSLKLTALYKCTLNSHPWVFHSPTIYLLRNELNQGKVVLVSKALLDIDLRLFILLWRLIIAYSATAPIL